MQEQGIRYFRVKTVAKRYDVSPATIYRAVQAGTLDAIRIGGAVRIPEHALKAFEEGGGEATSAESPEVPTD